MRYSMIFTLYFIFLVILFPFVIVVIIRINVSILFQVIIFMWYSWWIREHQQKTFVMPNRFWLLRELGEGGLSEFIKDTVKTYFC